AVTLHDPAHLGAVGEVAALERHLSELVGAHQGLEAPPVCRQVERHRGVPLLEQVLHGPGAQAAHRARYEHPEAHANAVLSRPSGPISTTYSSPGRTQSFCGRPSTTPS